MLIQQTQEQRNVEYQVTCQCYLLHSAAVGLFELAYFPLVSSESQDSHLRLERKKERKGKERKGKERKDYAFRRQVNEKPSIMPGCPET